jgi:putative hydrolase of the HAD superfamily
MTAPPLVLFDLDDTLCDYSGARTGRLRQAYGDAFSAAGIRDVDIDAVIAESLEIHPHGSHHFPDLLARHGMTDADVASRAQRWYTGNRFEGLALFTDAQMVLAQVRALQGVRAIGLVTNGPADVQRDKIDLLNLWPEIDFAVISGEFGVEKPDPAIFREALRQGDAAAEDAIYIGDSPEFDMEGAWNAGIRRIWMNRAAISWPLDTPAPEIETRTLTEIPAILANQGEQASSRRGRETR